MLALFIGSVNRAKTGWFDASFVAGITYLLLLIARFLCTDKLGLRTETNS